MSTLAREAGVNVSSVSRALRNDPRISGETRKKIQALAIKLNYRPNPLVSALMSARSQSRRIPELGTIAYIQSFPDRRKLEVPLFQIFEDGARKRAEQLGYAMEIFSLGEHGMTQQRLQRILLARGIAGVCLAPVRKERGHLTMNWEGLAPAALGFSLLRPSLHRASADHHYNMLLILRELRRLGYRRIGFCAHPNVNRRMDDLWLGAFFTFKHRHPEMTLLLHEDPRFSVTTFRQWFTKAKPDAIISDNSLFEGYIRSFASHLAFATLSWTREFSNQMGIDQQSEVTAAAAIDLIVAQLNRNERGIPPNPKTISILGRWRAGNS